MIGPEGDFSNQEVSLAKNPIQVKANESKLFKLIMI